MSSRGVEKVDNYEISINDVIPRKYLDLANNFIKVVTCLIHLSDRNGCCINLHLSL